eukprot:CAMPEP_0197725858 /NCGR_PEP_ID=MMETSP1434-20131217/11362_1 /TAXON_ID=265543 /ORGANISM="Minutocellus polymorphus, Strain CCMP3303" /LENGTH=311 /DNA_ID=CAMNT_0043311581 /DNA_START=23 /DNA_END=959 /DNA_ORIENTATION=+
MAVWRHGHMKEHHAEHVAVDQSKLFVGGRIFVISYHIFGPRVSGHQHTALKCGHIGAVPDAYHASGLGVRDLGFDLRQRAMLRCSAAPSSVPFSSHGSEGNPLLVFLRMYGPVILEPELRSQSDRDVNVVYDIHSVLLVALEYCQYKTKSDGTKTEYWLLRFPFEVHTGWIVAAFAVNSNVAAAKWEASAPALFGLAVASIVYIIICAAFCLFLKKPNYAVPLTLAWATFGIAEELRSPMDSISRNFSEGQIASIRTTSAVVCALLITCTAFRGIWKIRHGDREHRGGSTTGVAQEESMMGITSDPQGGLQ